ncbi:MAG: PDZ domain-containing protein, partial [Bacteroidota bacterium]
KNDSKFLNFYNRSGLNPDYDVSKAMAYKLSVKPSFQIVEVRANSNAFLIGIKSGDIIASINNKAANNLTLQQINKYLYDQPRKTLKIEVERSQKILSFQFQLDDIFKKKTLNKLRV